MRFFSSANNFIRWYIASRHTFRIPRTGAVSLFAVSLSFLHGCALDLLLISNLKKPSEACIPVM